MFLFKRRILTDSLDSVYVCNASASIDTAVGGSVLRKDNMPRKRTCACSGSCPKYRPKKNHRNEKQNFHTCLCRHLVQGRHHCLSLAYLWELLLPVSVKIRFHALQRWVRIVPYFRYPLRSLFGSPYRNTNS